MNLLTRQEYQVLAKYLELPVSAYIDGGKTIWIDLAVNEDEAID